jgi:L-fuculose-phosphate aldolase
MNRGQKDASMAQNIRGAEGELRKELARFGKWLYRLGFTPGTSGNLSVRIGDDRILATPTGCSKYLLRPSDMVIVDLAGRQISGIKNVTSEIGMHLAIYQRRYDVGAVVHAHPPIATGFASSGLPLTEPLCSEAVMALGAVPLAPYATTGTEELAASLAPFIPDHDAILLANHGVVTNGENLLEAFLRMETVEHFAHVCLVARQLGSARPLEAKAVQQLLHAKARYKENSVQVAKRHEAPEPESVLQFVQSTGTA